MLRPRKYYMFRDRCAGNVPLPKQARYLLDIIYKAQVIEQKDLLARIRETVRTRQEASRILTYYTGYLIRKKAIDILISNNKLITECPHCGGEL